MTHKKRILCIGEVLWDSLPSGLYLGGAPLNVCYHLNQFHINAEIASKVGKDRLGVEAVRRIKSVGIPTELIQYDSDAETGFVGVKLTKDGDPTYDILEPVAWDSISLSKKLDHVAQQSWGIVFGSLAQRSEVSRSTIQKLCQKDATLIFDMNLRKPFISKEVISKSLQHADIVKMNEDELNYLVDWFSLSGGPKNAVQELDKRFKFSTVCITKGANGSIMLHNGKWYQHNGFPVKAKDVVGAGDAFLASFINGLINQKEGNAMLACANATGSFVAQKDGAMPQYEISDINKVMV